MGGGRGGGVIPICAVRKKKNQQHYIVSYNRIVFVRDLESRFWGEADLSTLASKHERQSEDKYTEDETLNMSWLIGNIWNNGGDMTVDNLKTKLFHQKNPSLSPKPMNSSSLQQKNIYCIKFRLLDRRSVESISATSDWLFMTLSVVKSC